MLCTGLLHMVSGDTTRHSMQSVKAPSQQVQKVTRMREIGGNYGCATNSHYQMDVIEI